jgi:2-polyprenyl-3-methyl-5-hydroxy-6-metoxy-1,4-benzoquinol methylase
MTINAYNIEKSCPVCSNTEFAELIDFGKIPHSGVFLSSPEGTFQQIHLVFEYCLNCSMIRKHDFDQSYPDYREVNRPTKNQMPEYISDVIKYLSQIHLKKDELVIEIGGNDGAFMDLAAEAGCNNRLIIEPSISLAEVCRKRCHPVENIYFNTYEVERIYKTYGPARVIFCRHVLEHVPDPEDFFRALRIMTDEDGLVFLETPDARGITERLLGHELWDEHLFHFSEKHLSYLAERFCFDIQWRDVKPHRGGHNLLIWATPGIKKKDATLNSHEKDLAFCRSFKERWLNLSRFLKEGACNWTRPVACMGASHPQSNYIIFNGLGAHIDFMVDDDPDKIGSFVPLPNPIPVISTQQLLDSDSVGTMLLTAFGCEGWIEKIRRPLIEKGTRLIDPYPIQESI